LVADLAGGEIVGGAEVAVLGGGIGCFAGGEGRVAVEAGVGRGQTGEFLPIGGEADGAAHV